MTPKGNTRQGPPMPLAGAGEGAKGNVPAWVHLLPSGSFKGRDGRAFMVEAPDRIIAASLRQAPGGNLPLDYDHAIDRAASSAGEAPAAGWIVALEARADGVWGQVEWTPRARERIAAREYRFISPVIMHGPDGKVLLLLRAALTNNPNLSQLTALNSAGTPMDLETLLTTLRELLALPDDADADTVVSAVRELATAKNGADPARFVPIGLFQRAVAEANTARSGLSQHAAEQAVDGAIRGGRLMPWMRQWGVSLCMVNAPAFDTFVQGVGPSVNSFLGTLAAPAAPGKAWNAPPGRAGAVDEVAKNLGLSADDIAKYGA
jgi:phage I-like protein